YHPLLYSPGSPLPPHSFPTRRSSDLLHPRRITSISAAAVTGGGPGIASTYLAHRALRCCPMRCPVINVHLRPGAQPAPYGLDPRSEEHTSELQSRENLVCRLLLEKKN